MSDKKPGIVRSVVRGTDSFDQILGSNRTASDRELGDEFEGFGGDGIDLTAFMDGGPGQDLDWLDTTNLDPVAPKNPAYGMIDALSEAWTHEDPRTATTHPLDHRPVREASGLSAGDLQQIMRKAARRSAEGAAWGEIEREALRSAGEHQAQVVPHLEKLAEEHGLLGNVYLRLAHYPGWERGAWRQLRASKARWLVANGDPSGVSWIVDGRCTYTGKQVVAKVPWKFAMQHYGPKLELSGRRLAATGPIPARLRAAFLSMPQREKKETPFPHHEVQVASRAAVAAEVQAQPAPRSYSRRAVEASRKVASLREQIVKKGLRGDLLRAEFNRTFLPEERAGAVRKLSGLLKTALAEGPAAPRTYEATPQRAFVGGERRESERGLVQQIRKASLWLRRAMTEGFCGSDLDGMVEARLAPQVREAGQDVFAQLRQSHEGAAGFVYVDAEAYATPKGVQGCEKGGQRHRANPIKHVSAMPRCGTCTHVRTLEGGERKCGIYNKLLLTDTGTREIRQQRQANLKHASLRDHEQVQALFANPHNAFNGREYSLEDPSLEFTPGFTEEVAPDLVSFGGWDFNA